MNFKEFFFSWGMVFLSALFDSYAAYIVKTQFNKLGKLDFGSFKSAIEYISTFVQNPILISAVVTFAAAPAMWFVALNRLDLSVAYPILVGFHLVFVLVFGVFLLEEGMTTYKAIGCALVLLSLYFFNKH
jgi:multidrug transporter EmrE-like cation transporter